VTIRLNGEPHELAGPTTIAALLASLGIDSRLVAVEHNLHIIKRAKFDEALVRAGDTVEVVKIVGGG
jgi:thiamine biosynthesis protein ThiS